MKKYSNNWRISSRLLLVFWLGFAFSLAGQTPAINWQQELPEDTTIQKGVLANGLRYFIRPNQEPRQRAELRLVVKAGSLQEEADQLGVAHFVEHMAFNGTQQFAENTLIDFIERNGSRFGADLNAYTSFEETVYKLQVQTDSLPIVDTALQILAQWSEKITFSSDEVAKERGVIRSEWRSSLSSNQRLQRQAYQALLANSRYADRMPIGSPELIDTVAVQRLVDFYHRWYQPQNMAVVVVGDVDAQWVEEKIVDYFSGLSNQDFSPALAYPLDPTPRRSFLLATDDEAPFTRWEVTFQLGQREAGNSLAKLHEQLLYGLFGSLLNKRLAKLKETAVPPFIFAYSGYGGLPGDYRTYRLSGMGPAEKMTEAMQAVVTETRRAILHGFSEEELATEKKAILDQYEQFARELDKRSSASIAGAIRQAFLDDTKVQDMSALPEAVAFALADIIPTDLQLLAQDIFKAEVQTAIITTNSELAPTLPDSAAFYQTLATLVALEPPPLKVARAIGPLFSEELSPLRAEPISQDTTLNIKGFSLPNGVRFYLKPTDFKNDQIRFEGFSPGGISLYADEEYPSARNSLSILDQSGLDTFRESELLQLLSDRRVSVNPYLGNYEEGISGSSNQEDLETMFQLIYLYFTRPRFDSLALAAFLEQQLNIYERLDNDPRTAFGRMVIDKKYAYHPRRPNASMEQFQAVDLERAKAIYTERFADAADFQFVFVGNYQEDSLVHLAERYLGNLPTTRQAPESWQDRGLRLVDQPIDTTVVAGQTPKAEIMLEWHGAFPYEDREERLHFSVLREVLSFRLREKMREEMGGVYGVRVNMRTQSIPHSYHHSTIRFNAAPDQVDTLIAIVYEEITALAKGKVLTSDLDKVKARRLKSFEEGLRSNSFWLGQIAQCLRRGYAFERIYPDKYPTRLEQLTTEKIAQMAQKYLLEATHLKFLLLPE